MTPITTVKTTLYLGRERPLVTRTSTGVFQLGLFCLEPIEPGLKEPWRLHWAGPDAEAWYSQHSAALQPGQPLGVVVTRLRAMSGPRAPEIHARVVVMALLPRHAAPTPTQAHAQPQASAQAA